MKKTLLFSILATICSTISYSQTKIWDFGNDATTWPLSSGISNEVIIDNLGLFPIATNTNFGAVTAQNNTFSDGYTSVNRFQMNGGGGVTAPDYMPIQRYLYFDVDSDCVVKVWFKTGSNGAVRTVMVTDGTSLVGSGTTNSGSNTDTAIITANYTGTGGRLYIYGDGTANNLMKVQVTGANVNTTLSNENFETPITTKVFSDGSKIFLTNILSNTEVKVYSVTGALVKSFNTTSDTDFQLDQGLYIVNVKSAEGAQKSVKVLLN